VHYANDGSANPDNASQALYIAGYSHGAQTAWLEQTLAAAHHDPASTGSSSSTTSRSCPLVIGGDPVAQVYLDTRAGEVYKAVASGSEIGTWSAVRDPDTVHPWGIATFDLDPGDRPGGQTSISVNFYHTAAATTGTPYPAPVLFDSFTMSKRRRDGGLCGTGQRERILVSG
jgi:hypothetical protein